MLIPGGDELGEPDAGIRVWNRQDKTLEEILAEACQEVYVVTCAGQGTVCLYSDGVSHI